MSNKQADRTLSVYPAQDGWRWHLKYRSKGLAESGEAYNMKGAAVAAARKYGVGAGFPVVLKVWNGRMRIWAETRLRD